MLRRRPPIPPAPRGERRVPAAYHRWHQPPIRQREGLDGIEPGTARADTIGAAPVRRPADPRPGPAADLASSTLNDPPSAWAATLPAKLIESDLVAALGTVTALALSAFFSTLRAALQYSLPARVLARAVRPGGRERMASLLERAEALATSAAIFKITADLIFVVLLVGQTAPDGRLEWTHLGMALGIAAPSLLLLTEALPASVARARGDGLLLRALPAFHVLQLPVAWLAHALHAVRRALLRVMHLRDEPSSARRIVEGLREVIAGSTASGELEQTERELIEKVMGFGNVDAAEVMTPRTEINAVPLEADLATALGVFAQAGHSRVPVYQDNIDNIIGTVSALEVAKAVAEGRAGGTALAELVRPPLLVPETKLVSELLKEFQARRQKLAVVLDEYGGTAGVVTLTDVLAELVGDIHDEYGESEEPIRELDDGRVDVQAGLHVSEVNEALGLQIPEEEDFETLGGFVLAELGHFPKVGESFRHRDVEYSISEASDRRVLRVAVSRSA